MTKEEGLFNREKVSSKNGIGQSGQLHAKE